MPSLAFPRVVMAALIALPAHLWPATAPAAGFEDLLRGFVPQPQALDMRACERPSPVEFFSDGGCTGFLDDILNQDVAALRAAGPTFVLWVEPFVTPLYDPSALFHQDGGTLHRLPSRLPYKVSLLKLRTVEVLGLQLSDGLQLAQRFATPMLDPSAGDPAERLRSAMRGLGAKPVPSAILGALGKHDFNLLISWLQQDPDGLIEFLRRLEAVVDQL